MESMADWTMNRRMQKQPNHPIHFTVTGNGATPKKAVSNRPTRNPVSSLIFLGSVGQLGVRVNQERKEWHSGWSVYSRAYSATAASANKAKIKTVSICNALCTYFASAADI